ncbi:GNAT family N-acetyltransferase [Rhizobium halophytocola]|uniref:Ribosomal protein S18 acetylase RimI-like enzyme n=1 Tax=Rhizobium halophytocola TaxID=735519 RepID=A0ABS4DWM5_9HYPH|nr:GNAT family N-acetyltransferase [Rhizobium halophytocola]MBP1850103.1 ribosomal protein S18 acetylase RimI-like enzyme [Rhizobium halophytocola]
MTASARLDVRQAEASDLDWVRRTTTEAYAIYLPVLGYPPVPVDEDYGPRIGRGEVFVFSRAGADLGLMVVEEHDRHLELFSIAVAPAGQSGGVGRAMLQWLDARAKALGKAEIRLYTNARMERNIAIYTRFGYRETGRRANPKRPQFTIVDMVKPVAT